MVGPAAVAQHITQIARAVSQAMLAAAPEPQERLRVGVRSLHMAFVIQYAQHLRGFEHADLVCLDERFRGLGEALRTCLLVAHHGGL